MEGFKYQVFRAALNTLYFSGAHTLLRPLIGGVGAILMLHHVRPQRRDRFQPNHLLEVTPKFFERVIRRLRRSKVDLISLDEMHRRLTSGGFPPPPLRLRDLRRRLSRQSRIRLSGAEEIRGAVRDLRGDKLRRPDRRVVVARARSRDRPERHDRGPPRRPRSLVRMPQRQGQARGLQLHLRLAAAASDRRGTAANRARPVRAAPASTCRRSAPIFAWAGTNWRRSPPTRW